MKYANRNFCFFNLNHFIVDQSKAPNLSKYIRCRYNKKIIALIVG